MTSMIRLLTEADGLTVQVATMRPYAGLYVEAKWLDQYDWSTTKAPYQYEEPGNTWYGNFQERVRVHEDAVETPTER